MASGYISKTAYLKFEQCHKAFFLYKNHYYLRDKLSVDKQLTFKRGHDIGALAQQLFTGGINVVETDANKDRAIEYTKELIENKAPVSYEATFVFNSVLVMVDILVLTDSGYEAYEVKSSIKVSETYVKDTCLQFYVLTNCLPDLKDIFIVTLNDAYVLEDALDLKRLFKRRSVLKDALKNEAYFAGQISFAQELLDRNVIPDNPIGKHCFSPYECDFFGTCWKNKISDDSIFTLGKVNKDDLFAWYNQGLRNINDLSTMTDLNRDLSIQIKSNVQKEIHVEPENIQRTVGKLNGNWAAIDMEIWGQAVPELRGTRPFQKIPFLFTLYGDAGQANFFFEHREDERKDFASTLIEQTKAFDHLVVFDKSLESLVINELAALYPDLSAELKIVNEKFVDVSEIIHKMHYYHYLFNGNYSLKSVSKVILDEDLFADETIFSGLEAMNAFVNFRNEPNDIARQAIKDDLINYCQSDTKATYAITKAFLKLV